MSKPTDRDKRWGERVVECHEIIDRLTAENERLEARVGVLEKMLAEYEGG